MFNWSEERLEHERDAIRQDELYEALERLKEQEDEDDE